MDLFLRTAVKKSDGGFSSIEPLEARIAPATIWVTSVKDVGEGSLRAAIEEANAAEGADEIRFAKGVKGAIKLNSDLPVITDSVTISGPGAAKLTVNGKNNELFGIVGEELQVTISGMKLVGGEAENGGAVFVDNVGGTVTLSKTVITKNKAAGSVGPGPEPYSTVYAPGSGGGVAVVAGTVTIEKSKITGNKAGQTISMYVEPYVSKDVFLASGTGGGLAVGAQAIVNLKSTVISGNSAASGGGIHNAGQVTIEERSTISKNIAKGFYGTGGKGGGVFNDGGGTITIKDSKITGNRAVGETGAAAYYGGAPGTGGAAFGGGIFNAVDGIVSIINSKISGNKAIGGKGGTGAMGEPGEDAGYYGSRRGGRGGPGEVGGTGGSAFGGGIANEGNLSLDSSKVTGNASIGGAGGKGGKGGMGGQGAPGEPAYTYYGVHIPAKPPGPGGPGGKGGPGGVGGEGVDGGIHSDPALVTISNSKVSPNSEKDGARGAKGGTGKQGKRGPLDSEEPYLL